MSIIKNEIPILEFDTEQNAVLSPTPVSYTHLDVYKRQSLCRRDPSCYCLG